MDEGDPARVERVAWKPVQRMSVDGVADDGPPAGGEMHTNLVTPAGQWTATQKGATAVARDSLVMSDARRPIRTDDAPSAIGGIGAERQIDVAAHGLDTAINDGEILFFCRRPYSLKISVYGSALRDKDDA